MRIHVALENAKKERTEEHYEPSKTALRSEHVVEEGGGAEAAGVAGVPGARTNLPDAVPEGEAPPEAALAGAAAGGEAGRHSHTRNWEVDRVTQKTSVPPGGIRRLSVAVLLNGRHEQRAGKTVYVGRSTEELAAMEAIVKRAVGFDAARGDSVQLQTMEFANVETPLPDAPAPLPLWRRYLLHGIAGAGLLFVLAVLLLIRRRRKRKKREEKAKREAAELAAAGIEVKELPEGTSPAAAELLAAEPVEDPEVMKARALELAEKDPATAAVVLRKWLNAPSAEAAAQS